MNATPLVNEPSKVDAPLFNVVKSTGSHEDYQTTTLFATHDQRAALAYVEYQNELLDSMRTKMIQVDFVVNNWEEKNPKPIDPYLIPPALHVIPGWKSGRPVTPEMRAERKRLNLENADRVTEGRKPLRAWAVERNAFVAAWKTDNLTPAEALALSTDNETFYEIEDVAWMPPLESLLPADALAKVNAVVSDSLNDAHNSLGM